MDVVEDVANQVGRQASAVLTVAASELAKQANSIGQLANAKDPIAWLAGDEEEDPDLANILQPPEDLVPVPLATLRPWGASWGHSGDSPQVDLFTPPPTAGPRAGEDEEAPERPPPFEADSGLNVKIHLWQGNLCALEVDALIAPCAANYTCGTSSVFPKVLRQGGGDLRNELKYLDQCRSGEARIVKSYGMPSFWLVVSVGPKYKEKYHIAAENTLNTCYRECMQLVVESDLRTVTLPCIWYQKGYPPEEQAHVALRTMRKCLEKMRDKIDTVVFAASTPQEMELYESLLPRYFPRSAYESESGCKVLPDSCWNPWGEVTVEERRIKVSSLLIRREEELEDDDDRGAGIFDDADSSSFLNAREDADTSAMRRLQSTMTDAQDDYTARQICLRYLRKASTMCSESEMCRFTYGAGVDRFGRKIIVLLGARFPSLGVRDERTVPLLLKECEAVGGNPFIIVYVNSGVEALDTHSLEVLQEMFSVVSAMYSASLDQILIIHPRLWFRAAFVVGRAISDHAVRAWQDMFYLETLFEVEQFVSVQQLQLPDFVHHWDMQGPGAAGFL